MPALEGRTQHRGCALAWWRAGAGPPVLLIQGTGVHATGWTPQVRALAPRWTCLSFDNRGIGASQPAGAPITIAQLAEDAVALLDAQGWTSAHVVGHSLGGLVALHLALAARARVRSLALLCTFADGRSAVRLTPSMAWIGLRTRIGTARMRRHAFLELVLPRADLARSDRDALAAELAPLFGHDLASSSPLVARQLSALRACDLSPRLAELSGIPTLVVSAGHDRIATPAAGRALAAGIPGAGFELLPDDAHGVPLAHPERVDPLLEAHLAAAESARAAVAPS
jgi:3-oxoadipate enol-lactonase